MRNTVLAFFVSLVMIVSVAVVAIAASWTRPIFSQIIFPNARSKTLAQETGENQREDSAINGACKAAELRPKQDLSHADHQDWRQAGDRRVNVGQTQRSQGFRLIQVDGSASKKIATQTLASALGEGGEELVNNFSLVPVSGQD